MDIGGVNGVVASQECCWCALCESWKYLVKIDIGRQKGMAEREGGDGTTGMPAWPKISSVVHRSRPGRQ